MGVWGFVARVMGIDVRNGSGEHSVFSLRDGAGKLRWRSGRTMPPCVSHVTGLDVRHECSSVSCVAYGNGCA